MGSNPRLSRAGSNFIKKVPHMERLLLQLTELNTNWSKQLLRIFGPELIDQLKQCEARFQTTRFFLLLQPRNFENVTLVARRREYFRGFWADCFVAALPQKKGCFNTQEFIRFLSTGVVSVSSHVLWRVLSNTVIRVFGYCWVDIPHIYTSEWDSLFF